jgi:DNA-binding NtrC family response regulator
LEEVAGIGHGRNKLHVLVIDADQAMRSACVEIAAGKGFEAEGLREADDPQELLRRHTADILLMELNANWPQGLQLIEKVKALKPEIAIIAMTAAASIGSAVEAMRRGATDYLPKPFVMEQLEAALGEAARRHAIKDVENQVCFSQEMDKLYRLVTKVAQSRHPALIVGESGTGKETVARSIHAQGEDPSQPFLTLDCGALTPEQIECELFGCAEGAFFRGPCNSLGVLASAERGTVFLEEIGELSAGLQGRLLEVLQEKEIRRAGAAHRVPFHARLLATSSLDLGAAVTKGAFRKELYYRLNVVTLRIPPLRERRSDIPLLAAHFLERMSRETGQKFTLSGDTLRSIMGYDWPNNIRELENTIERACTLSSRSVIQLIDLPTQLRNHELEARREAGAVHKQTLSQMPTDSVVEPVTPLAELEKRAILSTIEQLKGDKLLAAHLLGIGKTTLYRKLNAYGCRISHRTPGGRKLPDPLSIS